MALIARCEDHAREPAHDVMNERDHVVLVGICLAAIGAILLLLALGVR